MRLSVFVLSLLHVVASITAVTVTNVTSYDPAELLAKIFNPNTTIEPRQRGYGLIKFEDDQFDLGPTAESQESGSYGLSQTGYKPLRFASSQTTDSHNSGSYGSGQPGNIPLRFESGAEENSQNPGLSKPEYNPLRFEDDPDQQYYTNLDNQEESIRFHDTEDGLASSGGVTFQDDNRVENQGNKRKRKRRRRRKPKNGVLSPGGPGIPSRRPDGRPAYQGPYPVGYGPNPYQGYPPQPQRRPRRPKPSIASEALASVTGALTSIALYDDYQCVPRLLCEAAGGGALANNGVLQSVAGVQPLLTLLSAYNGISSSPLFVFGRAVFLGMTSKGNTGTCRYAYPQCPTDPEQLIHYLNNHNGGFFRFFNAPQLPNQNLDQFYTQLGNQGYGLYQSQQQNYGFPNDPNYQNNGMYNQNHQYQGYNDGQNYGQNYGLQGPGEQNRPNLYNNQNYGPYYANDYNYGPGNQIRFKDSNIRIEKRIQNKPTQNNADNHFDYNDDVKTKWQFPDDLHTDLNKNYYNIRDSKTLKFPEEYQSNNEQKDSTRKGKIINFHDNNYYNKNNNNQQHTFSNDNRYQTSTYSYNNGQTYQNSYTSRPNTNYNYRPVQKFHNNYSQNNNGYQNQQNYYNNRQNIYSNNNKYQPNTIFNNEEYVFDHKHNFYVKKENNYSSNIYNSNNYKRNEDDRANTVYVVRGNGDPNNPEIVKLRPGQTVY